MGKSCQPCEALEKHETSEYYCLECQQLICIACYEYHKALKITQNHVLYPLEKIKPVLHFLTEIPYTCSRHILYPFSSYCCEHETLCCDVCKKEGSFRV